MNFILQYVIAVSSIIMHVSQSNNKIFKIEKLPQALQKNILSFLFAGHEKYVQKDIRSYCLAKKFMLKP
jgi:hypothetical protein